MSDEKKEQSPDKPDMRDLEPEKDPKAGGGFKPASGGGGGSSTQPVPHPEQ